MDTGQVYVFFPLPAEQVKRTVPAFLVPSGVTLGREMGLLVCFLNGSLTLQAVSDLGEERKCADSSASQIVPLGHSTAARAAC